jgi:hypothetical protein
MANQSVETSPQIYARIGGVLYLVTWFSVLLPRDLSQTNSLRRVTPSFCLWLLIKGVGIGKWNERMLVERGNTAAGST